MNEKDIAEDINARLASATIPNLRTSSPEAQVKVLASLITALESGLKILKRHAGGEPEPFPGAVRAVIDQQIACVDMARRAGLLS